jgi:hypothetical protein
VRDAIQANYEERLSRYAALIHGNDPPGLVAKMAVYSALREQQAVRGERLWRIEPLLNPLIESVEIDLHLATARLLEDPRRSERSLFKFLDFCVKNCSNIGWKAGPASADLLQEQLVKLESHRHTISMIMGRRDKFFAHLDKKYFRSPSDIYSDFPLLEGESIGLVNCLIEIIMQHESFLSGTVSFHVADFYRISVDNMVRNLETGRRANFPGQLD